jgi:hypothetical protein
MPKRFQIQPPFPIGKQVLVQAGDIAPPPPYDPERAAAITTAKKELVQRDRQLLRETITNQRQAVLADETLTPQNRVIQLKKLVSRQLKQSKLVRRYLMAVSEKCNRCDLAVPETTKHLLSECPHSQPALDIMAITIAEMQKADSKSRFSDLWSSRSDAPVDQSIGGDRILAYLLLCGFRPRRLHHWYAACPRLN